MTNDLTTTKLITTIPPHVANTRVHNRDTCVLTPHPRCLSSQLSLLAASTSGGQASVYLEGVVNTPL